MINKLKQKRTNNITLFLLFISSLFFSEKMIAQEYQIVLGNNNIGSEYLVGHIPKHSSWNFYKIRLEIFGGNWHNSNLGLSTYYISSRDGLKVNFERQGGSQSKYEIRYYQTADDGFDIVLRISDSYPSLSIKSSMINSRELFNEVKYFKPESYTSEGAIDITSTIKPKIISFTNTNGELGLNTTNVSGYRLSVAGKIRATEVKVYTDWADYVFEEDYQLKTLEEVEKHIKEYKHLPDVPSAKEVEENGVNLGESDAVLLRKIEELTLYTIKQEKEIDSLKMMNNELFKIQIQLEHQQELINQLLLNHK